MLVLILTKLNAGQGSKLLFYHILDASVFLFKDSYPIKTYRSIGFLINVHFLCEI